MSLLSMLLAFAAAAEPQSTISCRLASESVERAIWRKAESLKGHEYCQFRRYDAIDDFDGDGRDDFAVTFNVESPGGGGNHVLSFLFVFLSSRPADSAPLEAPAGERGTFWPESISADGEGNIVLDVANWTRGDALCCPSGSGRILFHVDSRRGLVRGPAAGR